MRGSGTWRSGTGRGPGATQVSQVSFLTGLDTVAEAFRENPEREGQLSPTPRQPTPEPEQRTQLVWEPKPEPVAPELKPEPVFEQEPVKQDPAEIEPRPRIQEANPVDYTPLRDTPRTEEALKRAGIERHELVERTFKSFHEHGRPNAQKQKLRFDHYELRRQQKINTVQQERAKVIANQMREQSDKSRTTVNSLEVIETMLDKELRRLEKNLSAQVRFHAAVEAGNSEQLRKERNLSEKIEYREQRKSIAKEIHVRRGEQIRTINNAKHLHSSELQQRLDLANEAQKSERIAAMMELEIRLQEHAKKQALTSSEKSDLWKQKCQEITQRKEEIDLTHELWGQGVLAKGRAKIAQITAAKEQRKQAHLLHLAEEALKQDDAKTARVHLENQQRHRRELLQQHMDQQGVKINELERMKQQVLIQRRFRAAQQSITKGRPMNLKDAVPGPGHYSVPRDGVLHESPVAVISKSCPLNLQPGSIDSMLKASRGMPPPGAYLPRVLPDGQHLDMSIVDGPTTRIAPPQTKLKPTAFIDEPIRIARHYPGPGAYDLPGTLELPHSVKLQPEIVEKKLPSFVPREKDEPGPGAYAPDPFVRDLRLQRASSSMPALRRALHIAVN